MNPLVQASMFSNWRVLLSVVTIGVSVMGAIPTAINIFLGWKEDIPWREVPYRLEQAKLINNNWECNIKYRGLPVGKDSVVDVSVGACPKTGDIAFRLSVPQGATVYQWIPFESLRKPTATSSLMDIMVPSVRAAARTALGSRKTIRLAQATNEVLCKYKEGKYIVQIIKEGGRCFRETFSPFKGIVEKREEVPCDTKCLGPTKT